VGGDKECLKSCLTALHGEQGKDDNDSVGDNDKKLRAKELELLHKQVNSMQKASDAKAKAKLGSLERAIGDVKGGPTGSAGRAVEVEEYVKKERTDLEALGKQILAALDALAERMQRLEEKIERMNQNIEALKGRDVSVLISDRAVVLAEMLYRQSPGAVELPLEREPITSSRGRRPSKGTAPKDVGVRYAVKTLYDALDIDRLPDESTARSFVLEGVADSGKSTVLLQLHRDLHKEMQRRNAEAQQGVESIQRDDTVICDGVECVVVHIDDQSDPPKCKVKKPDGTEVETERSRLTMPTTGKIDTLGSVLCRYQQSQG
jgi:preprotein translocase subunit YajC